MAQEQRFELVSTLGRGGMAEVFLGWMNSIGGLRRKVAIKRILPELIQKQSKLFQQMFVDEARLAFQLEHDNIVRVYDVGQTQNTFFIVMEYIEGFDLKSIMETMRERNTSFPIGIAVYIGLQVCAGLGYAHTLTDGNGNHLGLIHNDISPPNILIGRHGEVKVADFGLSDARSNDVATPEGMIKGKFAYISPEGTRNPPQITSKSDIFSIGICLWEMLAGRKLFQRETDIETFRAVQNAVIPDLRRIRDDIPDPLLHIVHKALAADPGQRYETCEALYLDLSTISTALGMPVNRYDLSWLVNDLADNRWSEFLGEKVSEDVQKTIQEELGGMLPPGDAETLGEIVTGYSFTQDDSPCSENSQNSNWVQDVFTDIGFENGDVVFSSGKSKISPPIPDAKTSSNGNEKLNHAATSSQTPRPKTSSNSDIKAPRETSRQTPLREVSGHLPSAKIDLQLASVITSRNSPILKSALKENKRSVILASTLSFLIGAILAIVIMLAVIH